jgi:molybdate transport system permease protein
LFSTSKRGLSHVTPKTIDRQRMFEASLLIPLQLTLRVASLATLVALVLGVFAAFVLHRFRFPGRDVLDALLTLPLVLPPTVLGYYLLVVVGRNSMLGRWMEEALGISLVFTWQGAVVAASVVAFPLVFKSARSALENVNIKYEDTARSLGCRECQVFIRVSFPLAWRGIMAGTMLAFARAMGEFGATLMLAGNLPGKTQTMSLAVYSAVQTGNYALANTLVIIISLVCVIILWTTGKLLKPKW